MGSVIARLDVLKITDLRTRAIVGIEDWEREKRQEISISVVLHLDLRVACMSDRVEDTVDYKQIKNRILEKVEQSKYYLIERLAEVVAEVCLGERRVEQVDVTVDKLGALRFARSVSVEITRKRQDG